MSQKGIVIDLAATSDPNITANDFAFMMHSFLGVSAIAGTGLTCTKINDNTVRLAAGGYFMRGRTLLVPEGETVDLSVDSGTAGQNRNDLVIAEFIRRGSDAEDDVLRFRVLKGTSTGGTPSDPALTQSPYLSGGTLHQEALFRLPITGTTLGTPVQLAPNFNVGTGWFPLGVKATYASATTFTIPGDWTGVLGARDRIMLYQGGTAKYFVVISVSYSSPNTTVTVTGAVSDTLTNAEILLPYFQKALPASWPNAFTLLWSGSWSSGTLSVPGITDYMLLRLAMDGTGYPIIAVVAPGQNVRGFGGGALSASAANLPTFNASLSGTTLTWGFCHEITHTASGSHSAATARGISGIYGII